MCAHMTDKIISTLVTDLLPDSKVLAAMNNIETKRREREAATQAAEAQKIIIVKKAQGEGEAKVALAEGEREAMKLQGEGVALQRKAIVDGLKESVVQFVSTPPLIRRMILYSLRQIATSTPLLTCWTVRGINCVRRMRVSSVRLRPTSCSS